jgi:hypothetical protein
VLVFTSEGVCKQLTATYDTIHGLILDGWIPVGRIYSGRETELEMDVPVRIHQINPLGSG